MYPKVTKIIRLLLLTLLTFRGNERANTSLKCISKHNAGEGYYDLELNGQVYKKTTKLLFAQPTGMKPTLVT